VLKICLQGECMNIEPHPNNGEPARCLVRVELDHNVPLTYDRYDIELFVPTEFATLLEVGQPITVTLEQNGNRSTDSKPTVAHRRR
jgi:hypothetical protein